MALKRRSLSARANSRNSIDMKRICFTLANGKRRYPKAGDFVQVMDWFGDVWAEIKEVNEIVPGYKAIRYYDDNERSGVASSHEHLTSELSSKIRYYKCRKIVTRKQLQKLPRKDVRIIHCQEGTYGRTKNPQANSLPGWPKFLSQNS
jgi:hypothetical protein